MNRVDKLWIQLGRNGDIINILPLLHHFYKHTNNKQALMIQQDFLPLVQGCSYISPHIWPGDFADLRGAMGAAKKISNSLCITQVYAHNMAFPRNTASFVEESYSQAGQRALFNRLPLIFDKRDHLREKQLVERFIPKDKPTVLIALKGHSSPFKYSDTLKTLLRTELTTHHILDLCSIQVKHFYDLLGLMDAATALITIDTAHMHLARASKVPTIGLSTSGPTPWHSTPQLTGQILNIKYNDFEPRQMEIIQSIRNIKTDIVPRLEPRRISRTSNQRPLYHVYSDYPRSGNSHTRHEFAKSTWRAEELLSPWHDCPIYDTLLPRNSRSIGDVRGVPFIHDLVELSIKHYKPEHDGIIVLTNDDISFTAGLGQHLQEVQHLRAAWSNRWDFSSITKPLTIEQVRMGCWCCGTDTFAFTPVWWERYKTQFPDMLLGCEAWDWVLRELIRDNGGFEVHCSTYHQFHNSFWHTGRNRTTNPGNRHNQTLAKSWLRSRGKPLRELSTV